MERKLNLKIEELTITDTQKLIGGFSVSFSEQTQPQDTTTTKVNNCNGGNYKAGCGSKGKKVKAIGSNANCKGNCVKGCGDTTNHH